MTLIGETVAGKIIEIGEAPSGGAEFVVQLSSDPDGAHLIHIPCTIDTAREAGRSMYAPMHVTFTLIAYEVSP